MRFQQLAEFMSDETCAASIFVSRLAEYCDETKSLSASSFGSVRLARLTFTAATDCGPSPRVWSVQPANRSSFCSNHCSKVAVPFGSFAVLPKCNNLPPTLFAQSPRWWTSNGKSGRGVRGLPAVAIVVILGMANCHSDNWCFEPSGCRNEWTAKIPESSKTSIRTVN
jgi:hypothetical protein